MVITIREDRKTRKIEALYRKARKAGYGALEAHRAAKIVQAFEERSDVRIVCEPDQENYFSVYGEPSGYVGVNGRRVSSAQERTELEDAIDRLGCWVVVAEIRCRCCGTWKSVDSVGMNTGYADPCDWLQNAYVPDLMNAALLAVEEQSAESLGS